MQAVASASKAMEFGREWQGQIVDGRFPLDQYLGGSDDKAVFLTRISGGATKAAIKLVRASACDPEVQLTAWRRATKLSHANLIRIFDGGRCWLAANDLLFVVTEYAEENLGQVLPQRVLSAEEADSTLRPTLDALSYLHAQGLVHGHLRPSNVMAVREQLKLSSDGIQAPGAPPQKSAATLYDAPEAARAQLSPAADVWSLGATLAEALTQRVPRRYDNGLKLEQPFADIVSHAMVEDPAARWTVRDIQARLAGKRIPAQKESTAPKEAAPASAVSTTAVNRQVQAREEKSRLPFLVAAGVALAIIAVVLFLLRGNSTKSADRGNTQISAAGDSAQPASAANTSSAPASPSTPGQVVNRVLPTPSRSALNTIHGTIKVRVKVKVDSSGNVIHAAFVTSGPSQYFARLAMQAAQQWKFSPAAPDNEQTLLFAYNRSGVDASVQPSRH